MPLPVRSIPLSPDYCYLKCLGKLFLVLRGNSLHVARNDLLDIHLVTPPSSASAIDTALATDPHLTSLPLPRANILAPEGLSQNTGTAEILRLAEVHAVITGDFVVLPCDLVCEVGGEALLETWMIKEASLGARMEARSDFGASANGVGGGQKDRRGGLGVWYHTKSDDGVKGEETDFIATSSAMPLTVPPSKGSLLSNVFNLVYAIPTDTFNDITDEKKGFLIRHSLLRKHGNVKLLSAHRDAHIYFFPFWTLKLVKRNVKFDSISEDLVGWWAKAGWQDGLGDKLGFSDVLGISDHARGDDGTSKGLALEDEIDLDSMTTSGPANVERGLASRRHERVLASRARGSKAQYLTSKSKSKTVIPPILAYVHSSRPGDPLIRRVDTGPLLLSVSLRLAKLESIDEKDQQMASPLAHKFKIASSGGIAQRCTITKADCLLAENVIVEEKSVIKESVIGVNCRIEKGARLTRCVLMDGVVVGERCQLSGCVLGRKSRIGKETVLRDCEVQGGHLVLDRSKCDCSYGSKPQCGAPFWVDLRAGLYAYLSSYHSGR